MARKRTLTLKRMQRRKAVIKARNQNKAVGKAEPNQLTNRKERVLSCVAVPETNELEIRKRATENSPARSIRFPKEEKELYQLPPEEFMEVQNAIEALQAEKREVEVYADSLESYLGYDSLLRVMQKRYGSQVAFYRSAAGGSLSLEEARKAAYRRRITDDEAIELFERLMRLPTEFIGFMDLLELNDNSPAMAQNVWEMIKREAAREFESGHRAAAAFEPADYMTDAWNRASYLGLRESFIEEYQPKGGIELSMIDTLAQSFLMFQHWTEESVRRAKTRPREENHQFHQWKQWNKQANAKQWLDGHWDRPMVSEQEAIEHAAQMADRWQRMYFRALRNLRDWRRHNPPVTINKPQQVNIAADGGQQINVSKTEEKMKNIIS